VDTIIKNAIHEINQTWGEGEDKDNDSENWNAREKIVLIEKIDPDKVYNNETDSETFEKKKILK